MGIGIWAYPEICLQGPPPRVSKHAQGLGPSNPLVRPLEEHPGDGLMLGWAVAVRLVIEMTLPYRDLEDVEYLDYDYNRITNYEFVLANRDLPFIRERYLEQSANRGYSWSVLGGKEHDERYEEYFERARDFIRHCALNNCCAIHG